MKIIGIAGNIGAGKSTLGFLTAEQLEDAGNGACLCAFADPLYDIMGWLKFGFSRREEKEVPATRAYWNFDARLHNAIEAVVGGWEDNRKAEFFARIYDDLLDRGALRRSLTGHHDELTISPRELLQVIGQAGRKVSPTIWVEHLKQRATRMNTGFVIVADVRFPEEAEACDWLVFVDDGTENMHTDETEKHVADLRKRADQIVDNSHKQLQYLRDEAQDLMEKLLNGK